MRNMSTVSFCYKLQVSMMSMKEHAPFLSNTLSQVDLIN